MSDLVRVKVTVTGFYDIAPGDYIDPETGEPTTSIERCCEIDLTLPETEVLDWCEGVEMRIEPA